MQLDEPENRPVGGSPLTRRRFLAGATSSAAVFASGGMSALLAGCGGATASSSGKLGSLAYQLAWVKNFEFIGSYFADARGYYKDEGVGVNLVAGGTTTNFETTVVSRSALVATSYSESTAPAINAGAPLVVIGSIYQKSPYAMVSRASNPIKTPQDMIGKKIGISPSTEPTWQAFLHINHLKPSQMIKVPVQVDPAPLAAGEVDGWLGYFMDEPSTLRSRGVAVDTMLFADFGFNTYESIYIVRKDSLVRHRDEIKAFMRAEVRGWQDAMKEPAVGAKLTISKYGKNLGLNPTAQRLAAEQQNLIVKTGDPTRGLLTLDPKLLPATIKTLAAQNIKITANALYDTSLMDEVYGGKTSL